jgi:hypothetical protein
MVLLRITTPVLPVVLALAGTILPAAAQDPGPEPHGSNPGPNATTPQADQHRPEAKTQAQPVPGAMPGSQTVPSTISKENAAADKQPILAYTFKVLTADQRAEVFNALKGKGQSQTLKAEIGTELPLSVALQPVPDALAAKVPRAKGYDYVAANQKVYLVQGPTRFVVGVFEAPNSATSGSGAH